MARIPGRATMNGFLHALAGAILLLPATARADGPVTPAWADIGAILAERCTMCHGAQGAGRGLRLDSYRAALAGGERGPVLVPGDPGASELVRRLRGESTPRMPFLSRPLPEDQIGLIARWIAAGMPEGPGP